MTTVLALWLPLAPAQAASVSAEPSPAWQQLRKELDGLQSQTGIYTAQQARRLADLSRLESAINDPRQRPTVDNATTHNLGVFVRGKRQAPEQPATFEVLAAGHETDDDVETVALFVPANVPLVWPGHPIENGVTPARVVRLLPGQELSVSDLEGVKGYALDLPAFAVETDSADLASLPSFSQDDLDAQPETAPVD
ncbi:MAG: hypothetical protein VKO26_00920 [Cyanobacteriota bacterium]|nr:hypothetical protein [Cyanobacteriota bacterium]